LFWTVKLVWIAANGRTAVRLCWRFEEARELIKFGMQTIGSLLADYVSRNVDNLIVGAVLGASSLGFYAMAYQVVRVPDMLISGPLWLYIFTAVARAAHEPDREALQRMAVSVVRLTSTGFAPLFTGLAIIADLAVPLVLGEKWHGAIMPLRWLAAAGFFFCLSALIGATLMALGRSGLHLKLSLIQGATTIVIVAALAPFGVTAVSAGLAVGIGLVCAIYVHHLARDLKMRRRRLFLGFTPAFLGSAAMAGALLGARRLLAGAPPAAELAMLVVLGAVVYAAVVLTIARRQIVDDARTFAKAQADKAPADSPTVGEPATAGAV
jgi:O-antigen/teichoic acid export membrane protein